MRTFARRMEEALGTPLITRNFSNIFGYWTREVLAAVRSNARLRSSLAESRVVTFNIGENDLIRSEEAYQQGDRSAPRRSMREFLQVYPELVDEILSLVPPGQAVIRTFTIYNPWPDHPLRHFIRPYNRTILRCCDQGRNAQRRRIPVARVDRLFRSDDLTMLLGKDGMHPSRRGHAAIGEAMAALGTDSV